MAGLLVVLVSFGAERAWLWMGHNAVSHDTQPLRFDPDPWFQVDYPGLDQPEIVKADEANLPEDEEVLGVEIQGHARAYRLKALAHPSDHLVNDMIAGNPVSVAYCDLTQCTRAFTAPSPSGQPLNLSIAGLWHEGMVLRIGDACYEHKTGRQIARVSKTSTTAAPITEESAWPLTSLPLTRTTWGQWRAQHPETDLYEVPARARDPVVQPIRGPQP